MIVVFWLERPGAGEAQARFEAFATDQLGAALKCAEALRARRTAGEGISHVSIQSELPEAVGPAGVADPDPGYAHYKRRIDPKLPLGRPSGRLVGADDLRHPREGGDPGLPSPAAPNTASPGFPPSRE